MNAQIVSAVKAACEALNAAMQAQRDGNKAARVIGGSVWVETVKAFNATEKGKQAALCEVLRSVMPTSALSYKTLTNSVSTAYRAIRLDVPLTDKKGELIGRTTVEKHCAAVDAAASQKADPVAFAVAQAAADAAAAEKVTITHGIIAKALALLADPAIGEPHQAALYNAACVNGITAQAVKEYQQKVAAKAKADKAAADKAAADKAAADKANNATALLAAMQSAQILVAEKADKAAADTLEGLPVAVNA